MVALGAIQAEKDTHPDYPFSHKFLIQALARSIGRPHHEIAEIEAMAGPVLNYSLVMGVCNAAKLFYKQKFD